MAAANRKSFLTYDPVHFSLTEGTNIPPPKETPPSTANGPKAETVNGAVASTTQQEEHGTDEHDQASVRHSQGPASVLSKSTSPKKQGVRRLFSLGSLRSSFSGSRASLSLPDHEPTPNGVRRPLSPSQEVASTVAKPASSPRPQSSRRSDSWFRRKSSMAFGGGPTNALSTIGEDGRPESKRARQHSPPPLLPEIDTLAGGDATHGKLDWNDDLFKKPA